MLVFLISSVKARNGYGEDGALFQTCNNEKLESENSTSNARKPFGIDFLRSPLGGNRLHRAR